MTTLTTVTTTNLYSDELSCPSCVGKIEGRLLALPGVRAAKVHITTGRIGVEHDPAVSDIPELIAAVAAAGYRAAPRGF